MVDQVVITQDGRKYGTLVTDIGRVKMADAVLNGEKVNIVYLAVGDGGGSYYQPKADQTALRGEKWRGEIAYKEIDSDSPNVLNIRGVVPTDVGGFTIREAGLFDDEGALIVAANLPDTEKAVILEGISASLDIMLHVIFTDMDAVQITVNPDLDTVSHEEVEKMFVRHDADMTAHADLRTAIENLAASQEAKREITIPASAWVKDADGSYSVRVAIADVKSTHTTLVVLDKAGKSTAAECGMDSYVETTDGVLLFRANTAPSEDIHGQAILFGPGGSGSGMLTAIPIATAHAVIGADSAATTDDVSGMLNEVFGAES